MAYWQYSFWFIPEKSLLKKYKTTPNKITENSFNSINWFDGNSAGMLNAVNFIRPASHWNKKVAFFGHYDSDNMQFLFSDVEFGRLEEIYCRVDLRLNFDVIVENLFNFKNKFGLMLLSEDLCLVNEGVDSFKENLLDLRRSKGIDVDDSR